MLLPLQMLAKSKQRGNLEAHLDIQLPKYVLTGGTNLTKGRISGGLVAFFLYLAIGPEDMSKWIDKTISAQRGDGQRNLLPQLPKLYHPLDHLLSSMLSLRPEGRPAIKEIQRDIRAHIRCENCASQTVSIAKTRLDEMEEDETEEVGHDELASNCLEAQKKYMDIDLIETELLLHRYRANHNEHDKFLLHQLALLYNEKGELDKSLDMWGQLLKGNPASSYYSVMLESIYLRTSEVEQEMADEVGFWKEAVETQGGGIRLIIQLKEAFTRRNDRMGALRYWKELIMKNPDSVTIAWALQDAFQTDQQEDAVQFWIYANSEVPGHTSFTLHLLNALLQRGDVNDARKILRHIAQQKWDWAEVGVRLNRIFESQDNLINEKAAFWESVCVLNSTDVAPIRLFSQALVEMGDIVRTLEILQDAVTDHPTDRSLILQLSEAFKSQTDQETSIAFWKAMIEKHGIDNGLWEALVGACLRAAQPDGAVRWFTLDAEISPSVTLASEGKLSSESARTSGESQKATSPVPSFQAETLKPDEAVSTTGEDVTTTVEDGTTTVEDVTITGEDVTTTVEDVKQISLMRWDSGHELEDRRFIYCVNKSGRNLGKLYSVWFFDRFSDDHDIFLRLKEALQRSWGWKGKITSGEIRELRIAKVTQSR